MRVGAAHITTDRHPMNTQLTGLCFKIIRWKFKAALQENVKSHFKKLFSFVERVQVFCGKVNQITRFQIVPTLALKDRYTHKHAHKHTCALNADSRSQTLLSPPSFFGPQLHLQDVWTVQEPVQGEPLSPLRFGHSAVILNHK